jgi:hypothetical protein
MIRIRAFESAPRGKGEIEVSRKDADRNAIAARLHVTRLTAAPCRRSENPQRGTRNPQPRPPSSRQGVTQARRAGRNPQIPTLRNRNSSRSITSEQVSVNTR